MSSDFNSFFALRLITLADDTKVTRAAQIIAFPTLYSIQSWVSSRFQVKDLATPMSMLV